jgi:hypothetical protein
LDVLIIHNEASVKKASEVPEMSEILEGGNVLIGAR